MFREHSDSARCVAFSADGARLFSASKDRALAMVEKGQCVKMERAHPHPIYCLKLLAESLLGTGDDEGGVKIWDLRAQKEAYRFQEHEETASGLAYHAGEKKLVSSSVEGTIAVYDLRNPKELYAMSDRFEEDLLGVELFRAGKKLLANSSEGALNLFSWDWFGDCDDRIAGHSCSIDSICKLDEDTLLTGGEDGLIRTVGLFPNKILRIVGDHYENESPDEHYPIGRVAPSYDRAWAGSVSHDGYVKFYGTTIDRDRAKQAEVLNEEEEEETKEEEKPPLASLSAASIHANKAK